MLVKLLRRIFAILTVAAYFGATVVAAAPPVGPAPTRDLASHSGHSHAGHSHQHDHESGSDPRECLRCCLAGCLATPGLAVQTHGGSTPAFASTAVLYSIALSVLAGRTVAPDPAPPRPTA